MKLGVAAFIADALIDTESPGLAVGNSTNSIALHFGREVILDESITGSRKHFTDWKLTVHS